MASVIVQTAQNVTLIGAGPVNTGLLKDVLTLAPAIVAVDGGAEMVRKCGKAPLAVLGDLDSVAPETLAAVPPDRVHRIADQDTTDFDKALAAVAAPLIVGLGFLGGRLDHQLAVLDRLAQSAAPVVLAGARDVVFRVPEALEMALAPGTRVSLYPMGACTVTAEGLEWPLAAAPMAPLGRISQSNRMAGDRLRIAARGPLLAILPRQALGAAARAIRRSRSTT